MEFGASVRRHRAHLPCASVAVRGDQGSGAGGRQADAEFLRLRRPRHAVSALDGPRALPPRRSTERGSTSGSPSAAARAMRRSSPRCDRSNGCPIQGASPRRESPAAGASAAVPRGVYLWGGVGRGKSFLMDCFFESVPIAPQGAAALPRVHARRPPRAAANSSAPSDPLDELGRRIARRYRLICFDEFHVADIADAMILRPAAVGAVRARRGRRDDHELPSRRALPERPAPRAHPAGDRAAEGQARGRQRRCRHRLPAPHARAASRCTTSRSERRPTPR